MFRASVFLCLIYALNAKSEYVTINKELSNFWYQTKTSTLTDASSLVTGSKLPKNIQALTLEFSPGGYIAGVKNFPVLTELFFDKNDLYKIPKLRNLPKIQKISLQSNHIKEVSEDTLSQTTLEVIILSSNQINYIEDGSFGSNVRDVYLTCNNLTYLSPTWFERPEKLVTLTVSGNRIAAIPRNMFASFVSLRFVNLRNNAIKVIGDYAFSGPQQLASLQLSYNNIEEFPKEAFGIPSTPIEISNLDIQYNNLTFLPRELFERIRVINTFKIWGNPWQCPCRDEMIRWWYNTTSEETRYGSVGGLSRDGDPSCVVAKSFQETCVYAVDKELQEYYYENFEPAEYKFCEIFL